MKNYYIYIVIFLITITFKASGQLAIDSGLVAFYPFCNDVIDLSNYDNDGTNFGATFVEDSLGNPNGACLFDGLDDYIQIDNSTELQNITNELSLSIWFRTNEYYLSPNGETWAVLLAKTNSLSIDSRQYGIYYRPLNNEIYFNQDVVANEVIDLNKWNNLIMTLSDSLRCYLNGGLVGVKFLETSIISSDMPLLIGQDTPVFSEFYNGTIDEIRIYDRKIAKEEIEYLSSNIFDCTTLSNTELNINTEVLIMPNPNDGNFIVKFDSPNLNTKYKIINYLGEKILDGKIGQNEKSIDISDLTSGSYFLLVETKKQMIARKIIKI